MVTQCYFCKKIENIPYKCSYCNNQFCYDHRIMSNHQCPFYSKDENIYSRSTKESRLPNIINNIKIQTSKKEIFHLIIATILVTLVGLSLNGYRYISFEFLLIFTSAFLIHELAHKFLAQYYGSWAEFRFHIYGLIITAISALPFFPFKFIAPGAVVIGSTNRDQFGKIALIGPLTNIIMGFSFLLVIHLFSINNIYLSIGASFNAWIALFNLLPFGVLDGQKIFDWSKKNWILMIFVTSILFIVSYL